MLYSLSSSSPFILSSSCIIIVKSVSMFSAWNISSKIFLSFFYCFAIDTKFYWCYFILLLISLTLSSFTSSSLFDQLLIKFCLDYISMSLTLFLFLIFSSSSSCLSSFILFSISWLCCLTRLNYFFFAFAISSLTPFMLVSRFFL